MSNENGLSPLELYINNVFRFLIAALPSIALCAGGTFTGLHLIGYYPTVSLVAIVIFDITCVFYTCLGWFLSAKCIDENGNLRPKILKAGKLFIALLMPVQWNFISYMIPSRDFWAYSFFFVLLASAFLNSRYLLLIIGEVVTSMLISWCVCPELLPVRDEYFVPEMVLRFVLIALCFTTIWGIVFIIEKRLAKELEKISDYDTLTLLYNRRKMDRYLENAIANEDRKGTFSVVMSDIDDFKKVNDTYGHGCGDMVLRNIAGVMRDVTGSKGPVFRYGGEEMLAILYGGSDDAFEVAETIRQRVEALNTFYEGHLIHVTLTLGVATYQSSDTSEKLIKRADANLYYGKAHGKNMSVR